MPSKKIGPVLATALVANAMIGSGIFLLPATLAAVGSLTIIVWIIAMFGALLLAAVFARLGQYAATGGGPCTYALQAFGPYVGFQSSTLYWMCCWTGNIAVAVAATGYLTSLLPVLHPPVIGACVTVTLIWLATWFNFRGARLLGQLQAVSLILGLIPIVLVATAGWAYFHGEIFLQSWNVRGTPLIKAIPASLVLVFWAFTGLESASIAADVVENPRRNVPIATVAGVLIAGLIYIAASAVIMGLIPAAELAHSSAPFADAVRIMLGPVAGALVATMALIKTFGTLTANVLVTTETGKAAADNGLFPRIFTRRNHDGIAASNLLLMATVASVVVFTTVSPTLGAQFGILIEVSTIFGLIMYIYACLSIDYFGRRGAVELLTLRYRVAAILACIFCIAVIAMSDTRYLLVTALVLALTVPAYFAARSLRRPALAE